MLFNSFAFAVFLPIVFLLYWFVFNRSLKLQNMLLLVASYYFYACWDWRFLFLLVFSTLLDYFTGFRIFNSGSKWEKRCWLWLSVGINLGFLGLFKYYNFFVSSFAEAIGNFGLHPSLWTMKIILPVGISFYTFHGLSYVIDIYYDRIKPEKNFISYSLFVSFFPLLVAGPIERATHLLPQVIVPRKFSESDARDGLRQMLWGFFKKMVVADTCARYVDEIFGTYQHQSGAMLLAGGLLFIFQIYGDFSGYSDIAIGCARMFGFSLLRNFANPFFSRGPAEFWRRWHISLSTWFRDYVFIPLGGSRVSKPVFARNIMIVFLVSGLWHGAAWTYLLWGALHGIFYLVFADSGKNKLKSLVVASGNYLPNGKELLQMTGTFAFCAFCFVIFRSPSVTVAYQYLKGIFTHPFGRLIMDHDILLYICIMMGVEWIQRGKLHGLSLEGLHYRPLRWGIYVGLTMLVFLEGVSSQSFIYFQF